MKKQTSQLIFKKGKEGDPENYRNCRLVSLSPDPRKMMQQILLEVMSRHMNDKVTGNTHLGFTKDVFCLTNMIAFYSEMTVCVAKGRAGDFLYFHISQAFDTVSHSILAAKLERCGLDKWLIGLMENRLDYWILNVISRIKTKWQLVSLGVSQD